MKRRLSVLLVPLMLATSLAACAEKKTVNNDDTTNSTQQMQEQSTQNESTKPDNTADKSYTTRIKVSINPDADILTDQDGKVVEIVCNNDDATTAYANLEVAGEELEDVAKEMVKAATDAGFMQDTNRLPLPSWMQNIQVRSSWMRL